MRPVGAVLPRLHPVELAVLPAEAVEDRVGAALHGRPPLGARRPVARDRVDGGLEAPDVLPHLHEQLALRQAGVLSRGRHVRRCHRVTSRGGGGAPI